MRLGRSVVALCLVAGLLPAAAGLGMARVLATWTPLASREIEMWAAGFGLAMLALIALAALHAGRSIDKEVAAPEPGQEDESASPVPPPSSGHPVDVLGLAEALAAEHRGPPGPALRKLLQYARPPERRPRLVGVNAAVEVCVRAMQTSVPTGWRLAFDPDPNAGMARIDPDSFHQLLLNLILNAREAAGPAGQVDIRTQAMDGSVLIAVRDDGPGVPAEEIDRIFEPFVSTKKGAPGLGLTICRRIAAAHGGTIWATNVLPHGLEVGVRLPQ